LIQAMMRVAVLSPAPLIRPFDAAISLAEDLARMRAAMAAMMGQASHERIARTRPITALVDVGIASDAGVIGGGVATATVHADPSQ